MSEENNRMYMEDILKNNRKRVDHFSVVGLTDDQVTKLTIAFEERSYLKIKRILDILLALVAIIPSAILVLFFGLLVKIETRGPMIYKHVRVGKDMQPFNCYKLRSMVYDPKDPGLDFTLKDDIRITKVGKIIRRFRIDELPQILNIFKNDMSWIGPRPLAPYEYEISADQFKNRTLVKPGISGLAQVNGGNDLSNFEKLEKDIEYIKKISFKTDLSIVLQTIQVVFSGNGSR